MFVSQAKKRKRKKKKTTLDEGATGQTLLLYRRQRSSPLLCVLAARSASPLLPQPALTYLGSFLEQGDHHRRVSAAHRPVEGTHPAVVYVLYHGPVVDQELDLGTDGGGTW